MGCDIHMYAEIKKKYRNPDAKPEWRTVGNVFKDYYYDKNETPYMSKYSVEDEPYEHNAKFTNQPYTNRNYDLFAILADVRNGTGFAGVDTGDGFNVIDEPRGIPHDASDFYKYTAEAYGDDGHSHSFFTIDEIEAFDWSQTTKHRGWVSLPQYKVFKETGKPKEWSGGVSGGLVKHLTNKEMEDVINEVLVVEGHLYTQVEWEETYRESVGKDWWDALETVKKLLNNQDVLDVRLVFFFDN